MSRPFTCLAAAGVLVLAACGSAETPSEPPPDPPAPPAPTPPTPGPGEIDRSLIVFQRAGPYASADTNIDIWAIRADGTGLQQLTSTPFKELHTAVSSDKSRVAFISLDPPTGIRILSLETGEVVPVDANNYGDEFPAWSPDGRFFATSRGSNGELWIVGADGSNPHAISSYGRRPSWSPDGSQLVFEGFSCLTIVNADGTNPHVPPALGCASVFEPAWSPDGKRIAFSAMSGGQRHIYTMTKDGGDILQLTAFLIGSDQTPAWSPDSRKIVFSHDSASVFNLYLIDARGGPPRWLTTGPGMDFRPSW